MMAIFVPSTRRRKSTLFAHNHERSAVEINSRQLGTITIIEVTGRMDAVTAPAFDKFFRERMTSDRLDFVIALNRLEYISSAGLRSILMAAKQVKARNGRLLLAGLSDAVAEVFNLSGFNTIVRICENEEAALQQLR